MTDEKQGVTNYGRWYNSGKWEREVDGPVDPRWWGAQCNGTFDDTAAFTSALAYKDLNNSNYLSVAVPEGTCLISSPGLTITQNQLFVGQGPTISTLKANSGASAAWTVLDFAPTGGGVVGGGATDLTIDMSSVSSTYGGTSVEFNNTNNAELVNLDFVEPFNILTVANNSSQTNVDKVYATNVRAEPSTWSPPGYGTSPAWNGVSPAFLEYSKSTPANSLNITSTLIGCSSSSGTTVQGLVLDGLANTTRIKSFGINSCGVGVLTQNNIVAANGPNQIEAWDLEVQSPQNGPCVNDQLGQSHHFYDTFCNAGGNSGDGFDIGAVTDIGIYGPRFNSFDHVGINITGGTTPASQVRIFGGQVLGANHANTTCSYTNGDCPGIGISGNASDVDIDGTTISSSNSLYGVDILSGSNIQLIGNNLAGNSLSNYFDNTRFAMVVDQSIAPTTPSVQPAATEFLLWTQDLTQSNWNKPNVGVSATSTVSAPDGSLTAQVLTPTAFSVVANQTITFSTPPPPPYPTSLFFSGFVYPTPPSPLVGSTKALMRLNLSGGTAVNDNIVFNPQTCQLISTTNLVTVGLQLVPVVGTTGTTSFWCQVWGVVSNSGANNTAVFAIAPDDTGTSKNSIVFWGANVVNTANRPCYIPATNSVYTEPPGLCAGAINASNSYGNTIVQATSVNNSGPVTLTHAVSLGALLTPSAGTGVGTGGTAMGDGNCHDLSCTVTVSTGTAPPANATIWTLTWASSYATAPHGGCVPNNAAAAGLSGATSVYTSPTTSNMVMTSGSTGLAASTTYVWSCSVSQ
jgi:hypothetical protein